jgi:hypothetical protein
VTYVFSGTIVIGGKINPAGTLFTYAICPQTANPCTSYMAQMPALP